MNNQQVPRTPAGWMLGVTYCSAGDACPRCDMARTRNTGGDEYGCNACGATWRQLHRDGKLIGYDPGPRAQ
jgi:hypothetical protein